MSDQNRREWADPVRARRRAASIAKANGSSQSRAAQSARLRLRWSDAEDRARLIAGIRRVKGGPEARAKFSELLRARWADPVLREVYLAGIRRSARLPEARQRQRERELAWWRNPANAEAAARRLQKLRAGVIRAWADPRRAAKMAEDLAEARRRALAENDRSVSSDAKVLATALEWEPIRPPSKTALMGRRS